MNGGWRSSSVSVDGVELRVHRTGAAKPPVVLAHGITDSGLCWARLARVLEADYDVVMVDGAATASPRIPARTPSPSTCVT